MMQCGASDLCRGREVTGSCTMTMLLPTCPALFRTSWLNIRSHKYCCPLFRDMALCDSFLFPQVKMLLKGNRFQDMEEIRHNDAAVGFSKEAVPKVLQTMEGPLEQMRGV
jgi:hypothetical protein